jgi:hypothetical protein
VVQGVVVLEALGQTHRVLVVQMVLAGTVVVV